MKTTRQKMKTSKYKCDSYKPSTSWHGPCVLEVPEGSDVPEHCPYKDMAGTVYARRVAWRRVQ